MNLLHIFKKPSSIVLAVALIGSIVLTTLAYQLVVMAAARAGSTSGPVSTIAVTPIPQATIPIGPTPTLPPPESTTKILGIDGKPDTSYPGIPWIRVGYPSCGWGNLSGNVLKNTIENYHRQGIRVLMTVCQNPNSSHLFDTAPLFDVAQGKPDAVQCGNEQMKDDPSVAFLHVSPQNFARFYDLCQYEVHAIRPDIPVVLGSLDPHVAEVDSQLLLDQVHYLDSMQEAMNTIVHPGGHWNWHTQTLGLIDSWHNGYPDSSVNNLFQLFEFWAQQFHVNLDSGTLGQHLWVVEGTGCFKGCGVDSNDAAQVAISHILTLITDVQTAMKYKIPFFYFSGKDFDSAGYHWPIGVLDTSGRAKPIRQDLAMGARSLTLSCPDGKISVLDQEQLLARMYRSCALPSNYVDTISR